MYRRPPVTAPSPARGVGRALRPDREPPHGVSTASPARHPYVRLHTTIPATRNASIASLVLLGAPAAYLGAFGLADLWPEAPAATWFTVFIPLSVGWHAAWLVAVVTSRRMTWIPPALLACAEICRRGIAATGFTGAAGLWAVLLELTLLAAAVQLSPGVPLIERVARWRRACDDLSAQLRLGPGLLPWLATSFRRALRGASTEKPVFAAIAASVRDAEARLGVHLSHLVLPEQLRDSLLTRARDLASQAELASIEASLALEHQALSAAVAFRDECRRLDHLTEDQRDAIARSGQTFLLEYAASSATPGQLLPHSKGPRDDVRH